ncbi:ATP-dependent helicase, partial [Vibrio alfacsensis]
LTTVDSLRDSLLNGTNASLRFLCNGLLPLVNAIRVRDDFAIASIIKKHSGVISSNNVDFCLDPILTLKNTDKSVEKLRVIV